MKKEKFIKNIEILKDILIFILLLICIFFPIIRQFTYNLIFLLNYECTILKYIGLIGIIALILFIGINYKENKKKYLLEILPIILFTMFMLWTLISCLFSPDRHTSFFGTDMRKDGYFTYIAYAGVFSLALCLTNNGLKKILLNTFIITAISTIILIEIRSHELLESIIWTKDITKGPFFNSNHYGYYLMIAVTIASFLFITEKNKILKIIYLFSYAFLMYYLIINNTFGCYLALFFTLLIFFIVALVKKEKRILSIITIGIFVVISIFTQTAKNINTAGMEKNKNIASENIKQLSTDINKITEAKTNPDNEYQSAGSGRLELWINGIKFFTERPILGYGPENLEVKYKDVGILQEDRPHNLIIQLLTTSGIPGCVFYLLALGIIIIRGLKNIDMNNMVLVTCLFTVIVYIGSSMFGNSMYYTSPYFYIILGFLMKEIIKVKK